MVAKLYNFVEGCCWWNRSTPWI